VFICRYKHQYNAAIYGCNRIEGLYIQIDPGNGISPNTEKARALEGDEILKLIRWVKAMPLECQQLMMDENYVYRTILGKFRIIEKNVRNFALITPHEC